MSNTTMSDSAMGRYDANMKLLGYDITRMDHTVYYERGGLLGEHSETWVRLNDNIWHLAKS